jgi:hypothetical protein
VRARAVVQRKGKSYRLELSIEAEDQRAQRTLESTSCKSVADAAAWFIAMALDPSSAQAPRVAEQGSSGAAPGVDEQGPRENAGESGAVRVELASPLAGRAQPPPRPAATRGSLSFAPALGPTWWRAGVHGGVWSVGLPAPQASVGARAGVGLGVLYTELSADWMFERSRALAEDASASFTTQQLAVSACALWGQRVRAGPCALASMLRSEGRAPGAEQPKQPSALWGSAGLSVQVGWQLPRWVELMVDAGVQLPISPRPEFSIDGLGRVAVASPFSVYARLGVGLRSRDFVRESPP